MPSERHAYMTSRFALTIAGVQAGFLKSVDGGGVTADVIKETTGSTYFIKKHISQPKYEPFTVEVDFSLDDALYNWITATWSGTYPRKDGSIITADSEFNALTEQDFSHAYIAEVTIPVCDASAKNPVSMTVKFAPESIRLKKGSGKLVFADKAKIAQKQWSPSNFRLEIAGLDCTKVIGVDSFTVKQTVNTNQQGESRDYQKIPVNIEFPNLKITLPESAAQTWQDWFEDFVITGHNDDSKEKTGSLVLLASDLKTELARITFFNLGICRLAGHKAESGSDQIKLVEAELYCDRMEFKTGGLKP